MISKSRVIVMRAHVKSSSISHEHDGGIRDDLGAQIR